MGGETGGVGDGDKGREREDEKMERWGDHLRTAGNQCIFRFAGQRPASGLRGMTADVVGTRR